MADAPNATPVETVPKTEFERVQTEAREAKSGLEAIRGQLLSQDYLDYVAAKSAPKAPIATPDKPVTALTLAELTTLIDQKSRETALGIIKPATERLSQLELREELRSVEAKYGDFEAMRTKVVEKLNSAQNDLTIEQAYLLAKAESGQAVVLATKPTEKPAPKAPTSEKPGGILPISGEVTTEFKTPSAAGNAAWASIAAKHGISGDVI